MCVWCVQVKEILQEEEDLSEIVQLVGKVCIWHHLNAHFRDTLYYAHFVCLHE